MTLDISAIEAILPHRPPFLMIDRVDLLELDRIVARKNVSVNEPFFQGHFPGHPVMPGVLIIEALAQAGAVLAASQTGFDRSRQVMYFMSIDRVKFRKPVFPGDTLLLDVVPLRKGSAFWKMRGEARVNDVVVTQAEFLAGIVAKPQAETASGEPSAPAEVTGAK